MNTASNTKLNNSDRAIKKNKKSWPEGNDDKLWYIKFFEQIRAIEYNHLRFSVPKGWRQEEKIVGHPFAEKFTKCTISSNGKSNQLSMAIG